MRVASVADRLLRQPQLLEKTLLLDQYLKTLSAAQLGKIMKISQSLAEKTKELIMRWNVDVVQQTAAIDSFIGDIYSGLQAPTFSREDRGFADKHLYIFSGLYGLLRPEDGICPYRLEMGYKLSGFAEPNLYKFWGDSIPKLLPKEGPIINLAADEYAQTITAWIDQSRMIEPKFLTRHPKTGEPVFVVVHAKIARGAFARWLICGRIEDPSELNKFDGLGYRFDQKASTDRQPVFVCTEFGGKGLSIRLN